MNPTAPPKSLVAALQCVVEEAGEGGLLYVTGPGDPCGLSEAWAGKPSGPRRIPATKLTATPPPGWEIPRLCIACANLGLAGPAAEQALARLRDLYCQRVILLTPTRGPGGWNPATLRALGFVRLAAGGGEGAWALFGFDLYDYKSTPDWLNPRFWAHPELWDRYRW